MQMIKIAIIGASYLQAPLIRKAKERKIQTHVFAWQCNDIGERIADFFYPISIVEKEQILSKCREIGIDGICSIASDLAAITVNYVANEMGLIGNTMQCSLVTTNKHFMRLALEQHHDPSPYSIRVESIDDLKDVELSYPVIVKPVDRSGSRGISRLDGSDGLEKAIEDAKQQGFEKCALVEEFAQGQEYSVEYISWQGKHIFLSVTKKYTTGDPHYIETAHLEPADVDEAMLARIRQTISHALTSLCVQYGATHSEIKISEDGDIKIIEIGARMGGDMIGSALVELSTGYDFVNAVIDVSLGIEPKYEKGESMSAAVRFVFTKEDLAVLKQIKRENPGILVEEAVKTVTDDQVTDSSARFGYFVVASKNKDEVLRFMPNE